MRRKYLILLIIVLIIFALLTGLFLTEINRMEHFTGEAAPQNEFKDIKVSLAVGVEPLDVMFGWISGSQTSPRYCLYLTIENFSNDNVTNCTFIFDNKYKATLKDLRFYYGPLRGNKPYDKNYIEKKSIIKFAFDDDAGNSCFDDRGNSLPRNIIPESFSIRTDGKYGEWLLVEKNSG